MGGQERGGRGVGGRGVGGRGRGRGTAGNPGRLEEGAPAEACAVCEGGVPRRGEELGWGEGKEAGQFENLGFLQSKLWKQLSHPLHLGCTVWQRWEMVATQPQNCPKDCLWPARGYHCSGDTPVIWVWQDDDSNFHVDFVVAATDLRCQNYGILPVNHARVTSPLWSSGLEVRAKPDPRTLSPDQMPCP